MNTEELSKILKIMYEDAPTNEQVVHIHLFGIKLSKFVKPIL